MAKKNNYEFSHFLTLKNFSMTEFFVNYENNSKY